MSWMPHPSAALEIAPTETCCTCLFEPTNRWWGGPWLRSWTRIARSDRQGHGQDPSAARSDSHAPLPMSDRDSAERSAHRNDKGKVGSDGPGQQPTSRRSAAAPVAAAGDPGACSEEEPDRHDSGEPISARPMDRLGRQCPWAIHFHRLFKRVVGRGSAGPRAFQKGDGGP